MHSLGSGHPLPAALDASVMLLISDIKQRGGITDADIDELRRLSDIIGCKGDAILYRGEKKGDTAQLFNSLAYALSVAAFLPGGVTMFGVHYEESS